MRFERKMSSMMRISMIRKEIDEVRLGEGRIEVT